MEDQKIIKRFSWKLVLFLVFLCLAVQYIGICYIEVLKSTPCPDFSPCQKCPEKDQSCKSSHINATVPTKQTPGTARKHILLFSQTRSGSSFARQLFNQHPDIFYMYEPLYHPKQILCNSSKCLWDPLNTLLQAVYRDLLFNLYTCDLNFLENYIQPEPDDHVTASLFRHYSSNDLCSPPICQEGNQMSIKGHLDERLCHKNCRILNLTLASMACHSRSHVSIKTVRMPRVTDLRVLTEDPRLDMRIIHLVRDPRAILASRITTFLDQSIAWKTWNATNKKPHDMDLTEVIRTCQDMEYSVNIGLKKPIWLHGRYLLVRYEDLALNPEAKAREIYKFLDLDIDNNVLTWISQNTKVNSSSESKYSTSKDSKITSLNWRRYLGYDIVKTVQALCNNTLALLGYKIVQSEAELRNISNSLVQPKTFG